MHHLVAQVIAAANGPRAAITAAYVGQGTFVEKLRALGAYAGGSGALILGGGTAAPLSAGSGAATAVLQAFEASTQVSLASFMSNCESPVKHFCNLSSMLHLYYLRTCSTASFSRRSLQPASQAPSFQRVPTYHPRPKALRSARATRQVQHSHRLQRLSVAGQVWTHHRTPVMAAAAMAAGQRTTLGWLRASSGEYAWFRSQPCCCTSEKGCPRVAKQGHISSMATLPPPPRDSRIRHLPSIIRAVIRSSAGADLGLKTDRVIPLHSPLHHKRPIQPVAPSRGAAVGSVIAAPPTCRCHRAVLATVARAAPSSAGHRTACLASAAGPTALPGAQMEPEAARPKRAAM